MACCSGHLESRQQYFGSFSCELSVRRRDTRVGAVIRGAHVGAPTIHLEGDDTTTSS